LGPPVQPRGRRRRGAEPYGHRRNLARAPDSGRREIRRRPPSGEVSHRQGRGDHPQPHRRTAGPRRGRSPSPGHPGQGVGHGQALGGGGAAGQDQRHATRQGRRTARTLRRGTRRGLARPIEQESEGEMSVTTYADRRAIVVNDDCKPTLATLEENSIDSIVTDPPYELGFMGKKWDGTGIAYDVELWEECLRVLKPGGHLLAFGGSQTWHRMAVAIEDAGFELRDSIAWLYGSGFPKSLDVSKAIEIG